MGITKTQYKVVCYNCRKTISKEKAFYLLFFDTYLCEKCYLNLLKGEKVKLSNWRKRGV